MTAQAQEDRQAERVLLLRKIFDGLTILVIGRELQDRYCMQFDDSGYDKGYRYYDEKTAASSVSEAILDDDRMVALIQKHRDRVRSYWSFLGKYYTYDPKKKELRIESTWPLVEQRLENLFSKHGLATYATLKAYIELRNDSGLWSACDYSRLAYRAKELGGKGWKQALVALEIDGVIEKRGSGRRPGERSISLELIPLVERVLSKWEKQQATTLTHDQTSGTDVAKVQRGSLFLSHSNVDSEFALKFGSDLERRGIRVWIYEAEMSIGDSLIEKISKAIDETDYVGVILSQSSVRSEWVKKEVDIAMTREIRGKRLKVLPFLLEDCEIPVFLQDKVYADFRNPSHYHRELAKVVKRLSHRSLSELTSLAQSPKGRGWSTEPHEPSVLVCSVSEDDDYADTLEKRLLFEAHASVGRFSLSLLVEDDAQGYDISYYSIYVALDDVALLLVSKTFLKQWKKQGLETMVSKNANYKDFFENFTPIWLDVRAQELTCYSPYLANRYLADGEGSIPSDVGIDEVLNRIIRLAHAHL